MNCDREPYCPKCARSCTLEERRSVVIHLSNWALMVPVAVGVFALGRLIYLGAGEAAFFALFSVIGLCLTWRHKYFCSCCEIEFVDTPASHELHHS